MGGGGETLTRIETSSGRLKQKNNAPGKNNSVNKLQYYMVIKAITPTRCQILCVFFFPHFKYRYFVGWIRGHKLAPAHRTDFIRVHLIISYTFNLKKIYIYI